MRRSVLYVFGLVVTALVALGLIVLSSAGEANGFRLHGDPYHFIKFQAAYLVAGIVLAAVLARMDYHVWKKCPWLGWVLLVAVFGLLCLVFLYPPVNGSHRWIRLGPLRLQPSEFAKITVVLVLASWMDRQGPKVETFVRGMLVPGLVLVALAIPVKQEPDFGSVMVIGATGLLILWVAGTRVVHLVLSGIAGAGVVAVDVLHNANRMARIAAWLGFKLEVGAEVQDAAAERAMYQAKMALVAIKNGGIFGVGVGESMQKHLYLPEAHTDFIFAVGAEELGLIFTLLVFGLFIAFFVYAVRIAWHAPDRFGRYLVVGTGFIVFFQAMFNMGVVCGALPTKGMALPFFSYGGTNMLSTFAAVGIILSVGRRASRPGRLKGIAKKLHLVRGRED